MKRLLKGSVLALLAFAAFSTAAAAQSVAGTWIVVVNSPEVGEIQFEFVLEQDGTEVTGTAVSTTMPELGSMTLSDGIFEDGLLTMLMLVSVEGQSMTVEIEGEVDGDDMVGESYVVEMGSAAPFTATRSN